jgi:lipoate-protein ligase A
MLLVNRESTKPYFNVAAEEYFLKNFDEEVFMLWQNEPSIVVGKHQNTMGEVNISYAHKNNIPVIRRITGGGTVYHDLGNLNYTFITNSDKRETLVDFKRATKPVIDFIGTLGVKVSFSGKNNLIAGDKKISGNSAHVYKNRVIHHGTILINSNLDNLNMAITPGKYSISDKAVKSIRATVTNLNDLLQTKVTVEEFKTQFIDYIEGNGQITTRYDLTQKDEENISKLVSEKYNTWEWNYGYSPSYTFENELGSLRLKLVVTKGIIIDFDLTGNIEGSSLIPKLLVNLPMERSQIDNCFSSLGLSNKSRKKYFKLMGFGGSL